MGHRPPQQTVTLRSSGHTAQLSRRLMPLELLTELKANWVACMDWIPCIVEGIAACIVHK